MVLRRHDCGACARENEGRPKHEAAGGYKSLAHRGQGTRARLTCRIATTDARLLRHAWGSGAKAALPGAQSAEAEA
eukprot:7511506-Alexandrium_andersonii.AAC.1